MEVQNSTVVYKSEKWLASCFSKMQNLRSEGKLCDITLKVHDRSIYAHRVVLASTIPFFRAMFESDMRETHQNDVPISGIDPDALESFVQFAYTGKLQIDSENGVSILAGASFLMLNEIEDFTTKFLQKRLTPENALNAKFLADLLGKADLSRAATSFISNKFYFVTRSTTFNSMDESEQIQLRKLYGHVRIHEGESFRKLPSRRH